MCVLQYSGPALFSPGLPELRWCQFAAGTVPERRLSLLKLALEEDSSPQCNTFRLGKCVEVLAGKSAIFRSEFSLGNGAVWRGSFGSELLVLQCDGFPCDICCRLMIVFRTKWPLCIRYILISPGGKKPDLSTVIIKSKAARCYKMQNANAIKMSFVCRSVIRS